MDLVELPDDLVERHIAEQVREYIDTFRVTVINGPRQAGKTTLLRQLHRDLGGGFVTLDDAAERTAARTDPQGFLEGLPRPLFIDEVQRGGESLVLAVKAEVDRLPRRRGSFIMSGSSRFLTVPTLSESLAGRVGLVDLWPFSVPERLGVPSAFLDQLLSEPVTLVQSATEPMTRHEYLQLACAGGFPDAVDLPFGRSRTRWFRTYLNTVIQRELADATRIRHLALLPQMVRVLAATTAGELNAARLANDLGIDPDTVRSYLSLLETVYLIRLIPAWSRNLSSRVKHRPKIHLVDTGLAAWLRNQSADSLARPAGSAAAGALFETFVVGELIKLCSASEIETTMWHYQDRHGGEIDCILETPDGRVVGIEVKIAATARAEDFKHLRRLRDQLGDDLIAGVVLFAGPRAVPFGDRLYALPASLLWGGTRPPS